MRNDTGFKDINGQKIRFGDTVVDWNTGLEGVHSAPYVIRPDNWTLESLQPDQFPMIEVLRRSSVISRRIKEMP